MSPMHVGKARFWTGLTVTRLKDGISRLDQPLIFDSVVLDRRITVPPGFKTDFASVPRLPFAYWLFGGVADEAAVVHDYTYTLGTFSREKCDKVFLEALEACGVGYIRRTAMYRAVRLFGGPHHTPTPR